MLNLKQWCFRIPNRNASRDKTNKGYYLFLLVRKISQNLKEDITLFQLLGIYAISRKIDNQIMPIVFHIDSKNVPGQ